MDLVKLAQSLALLQRRVLHLREDRTKKLVVVQVQHAERPGKGDALLHGEGTTGNGCLGQVVTDGQRQTLVADAAARQGDHGPQDILGRDVAHVRLQAAGQALVESRLKTAFLFEGSHQCDQLTRREPVHARTGGPRNAREELGAAHANGCENLGNSGKITKCHVHESQRDFSIQSVKVVLDRFRQADPVVISGTRNRKRPRTEGFGEPGEVRTPEPWNGHHQSPGQLVQQAGVAKRIRRM
mmetsp:Transcript_82575/g.210067  ORF Transcript_82575/g.210067 Transcript_82575/m.210067 type:complete len:241 (+) Transcript_82575:600-1322(+)